MHYRSLLAAIALPPALWVSTAGAQVFDYGKYPDLRGQWVRWGPSGPDLKGPLVRHGPTGFNGARFDPSKPNGAPQEPPLTPEYQALFKERMSLDKTNPNIFHDDVTVIDHALTRPWTVNKTYGRDPDEKRPYWHDDNCGEHNN